MTDYGSIEECETLATALAELIDGQQLLLVAAAVGHVIGRTVQDPEHMLAFLDTLAANASLYSTCSCGECDRPTCH